MSTPRQPGSAGLGWVTLDDGVVYSQAWLTANTPGLFAAWGRAQTQQQRQRLVAEIQQVAAAVESADKRDPRLEYVPVRIQWAETTRYEAELYLDPNSSEDKIWSEIANLPDADRRTLDVTDEDNRIISVVDLDGDGTASVLERGTGDATTVDWGDLADSIDEQIAESPGWPALNTALTAAAASGYDVATGLPQLAEPSPLPADDPASELHYRLLSSRAAPIVWRQRRRLRSIRAAATPRGPPPVREHALPHQRARGLGGERDMAKPTALDMVADVRAPGSDVAEVATDGLRFIAGATDPGATYQTRLEYRDNPNAAWTTLDSWAIATSSASAAIMTALKLEQDLGGLKTADVQELTRAVILSAARAHPPGAFVDTRGTEPRTAKFDTTEYGHTQARSADEALIECLSRVVREIYDMGPDAGGEAARNFVQHTPNPDQVTHPFDRDSDAFLLQAIAAVARNAAAPSDSPTASGRDVTRQWERLVSQIAPPAVADPAWAGLAATLSRAAALGWDVPGGLRRLVSENPLPDRHPALELQCRVMAECEASMPPPPSIAEINGTSADRARSRSAAEPPLHRAQQATSTSRDAPGR